MIVRELRLIAAPDGSYYLASQPPAALETYTTHVRRPGDIEVSGTHDLDLRSTAFDLSCELRWDASAPPSNIGFEIRRAPEGGRHVTAGAFLDGGYAYVNRRPTFNPGNGGESQTPIDPAEGRLRLRIHPGRPDRDGPHELSGCPCADHSMTPFMPSVIRMAANRNPC